MAILAVACSDSRYERAGDRAYADGRYAQAIAEYRTALSRGAGANVHAKLGVAALHSADLVTAVEGFTGLASAANERAVEAADGLERVARAAVVAADLEALESAVEGLNQVAAGRPIGEFAQQLARNLGEAPRSEEALMVLRVAAAAASDVQLQDSLMGVYGAVLQRLGRCEDAANVFASLVRRDRAPSRQSDRGETAACALERGITELNGGDLERAETWLQTAAGMGAGEQIRRRAYLGLGDLRLKRGDYSGAMLAFGQAQQGLAPGDSLYDLVQSRITSVGDAGTAFR